MEAGRDKILEEIEKIKDKVIIVEGKKDKKALESFGVKKIIILKKGIFETCEEVSKKEKEVVILTDMDKEGKKLYLMIKKDLENNKVKVDNDFRRFLLKETVLRHIEGLATYVENINDK